MSPLAKFLLIFFMLFFGSWNTLNLKMQFNSCVPGLQPMSAKTIEAAEKLNCAPGEEPFAKPWFQNLTMFFGEASILIVYLGQKLARRNRNTQVAEQNARELLASGGSSPDAPLPPAPLYIFAIPACCDFFGSGLGSVALLYIDASVWQMMRGALIVFTGALSVCFLGRRLTLTHYLALGVVVAGLIMVGLAAVLEPSAHAAGTSSNTMFGICMVVGAQVVQAFQMVFEEKLLCSGRWAASAKKTVGMEGVWGASINIIAIVLMTTIIPGSDHGKMEYWPDTLENMKSMRLWVLIGTFMASIACYNWIGLTVSKEMSAVVRVLVDSCRTASVWLVTLIMYYSGDKSAGAPLTVWSLLQLGGFAFLILGTLMYNKLVPIPCIDDEEEEEPVTEDPPTGQWSPKVHQHRGAENSPKRTGSQMEVVMSDQ